MSLGDIRWMTRSVVAAVEPQPFISTPRPSGRMRTYRFVRFLGDRVETASREVAATAAHAPAADEQLPSGDAPDPHATARRELPRAVVANVDGATKGATRLSASTVSVGDGDDDPTAPELGVVYHAAVPDFEYTNALVATTVAARGLEDPAYSLAESNASRALDRLRSITADAFVFVVGERRVHAVPAQAVAALTDPAMRQVPHRVLYARRFGRTVEEFAEGFLGDARVAPALEMEADWTETERRLRAWGADHDLRQVLYIEVEAAHDGMDATLREFV